MTLLNMSALEDDAFHSKELMKDTANLLENSEDTGMCKLSFDFFFYDSEIYLQDF